jgi:hypothetical protein
MARMSCPITREDFQKQAQPIKIVINGVEMQAMVKEFSTGSFGWYLTGKLNIEVAGKHIPVQVGLNATVIGSKEAAREA